MTDGKKRMIVKDPGEQYFLWHIPEGRLQTIANIAGYWVAGCIENYGQEMATVEQEVELLTSFTIEEGDTAWIVSGNKGYMIIGEDGLELPSFCWSVNKPDGGLLSVHQRPNKERQILVEIHDEEGKTSSIEVFAGSLTALCESWLEYEGRK